MTDHNDISQLCRLCLVKDKVNHSIFGESGDFGGLLRKINSCLPVSISKNDGLPKRICDACSTKLDLFYQFRNDSIKAEQQLLQWFHKNNTINNEEDLIKMNTAEIKEEIIEIQDNKTDTVGYNIKEIVYPTSTSKDELPTKRPKRTSAMKALEHMESEDDDDDFDEGADDYGKDDTDDSDKEGSYQEGPSTSVNDQPGPSGMGKGSSQAPLIRNGDVVTDLLEISYIKTEIESDNESLKEVISVSKGNKRRNKCRKSKKKSTKKIDDDDDNEVRNADNPVHCELCDRTYKNNIMFAYHSIEHNDDEKYSCHFCSFRSNSKYHTEMHVRAHEGTSKYKCEICNKAFTVSTHAIEHKYFHTGEKPFQCEICGKHFMFSWFLTSHRRSQHWEIMTGMPLVKYDCLICQKHYTSASGLKRHQRAKHQLPAPQVSVLCDICGKSLSSKEKLKFHRRIHTGYKPFGCKVCTKSFSRKEQLKEHERVHTGEKPYVCGFCGKGFSQRSPLRIHERIHTGERPYTCRLCGRGFISKGVMDGHMKNCDDIMRSSVS